MPIMNQCAKIYVVVLLLLLITVYLHNLGSQLLRQHATANIYSVLEEHHLSQMGELFRKKGISQLSQCSQLSDLPELPAPEEERLQKAASILQRRLILRQWLSRYELQHYYQRLLGLEVDHIEDVYWLEDGKTRPIFQKDFEHWSRARQSLPTSKQQLEALKSELWSEVVKSSHHQDAWTWGGMLVVSVSVAGLITLAAMTQPSLAPEAKHSLLQYVTGKYLLPSNCKVIFKWKDPHPVGHTMCLMVQFFQRNGQPYPICDTDNFVVDVTEGSKKMVVITELGSPTDPNSGNVAKVKFTVRQAGQYRIAIMVGGHHVAGSPFMRTFMPGPVYAQRTVVVRHCSTLVCTANVPHTLHIEPRDEYNNVCQFDGTASEVEEPHPTEGYVVHISSCQSKFKASKNSVVLMQSSTGGSEAVTRNNGAHVNMHDKSLFQSCNENNIIDVCLDYDRDTKRISAQLKFYTEGWYRARITYRNTHIHNGDFDIIVLSLADSALVHRNVAANNHNVCYDARLVHVNGVRIPKPKKVQCYVSPKQLIVKELILKFIPKRLYTFRLCPSTKFLFDWYTSPLSFDSLESWDKEQSFRQSMATTVSNALLPFTIDDGCQPKIGMVSRDRNVIAATFAQFLLKNVGGSETFKDKQDFFYHEVRKFHAKHYHEKLSIKVQRDRLLESSMKATKHFSVSDWCRNFEITFQGEQGIDWGGLRREWFELICGQLFDAKNGLFRSFREDDDGGRQSLVHPNANRASNGRFAHLKLRHFEFAGKVVGKCLYESALGGSYRQLVRARFTRSFLAQVIGLRVHYKYFEQDDPDLYLSKVKYLLEHDIDRIDTELYFVEEQYDVSGQLVRSVDLIPNGSKIRVRDATKLEYLDALSQYRLATTIRDEMEAFLKGLNELIPDNLLSIFDENELELLLCGTGSYSIEDFKAHHVVNGSSPEFRRIMDWFWAAIGNFTQEEMARLLQFATGCSQLPPGGFKELTPRFQITAAPTFGNLPTAHTCFNQLCLPDYDCYEHFEKSLLLAISEGAEGFGMV